MSRFLAGLVVLVALAMHALGVWEAWGKLREEGHGRDFASYHYAVQVAADGGDPYRTALLEERARAERTRRQVHPFFYPPPFLLGMAWALPLDLVTAWRAWFWLDELALIAAMLALWAWWRPLGGIVPVAVVGAVGVLSAIPDNHLMGQANLPVLALVIAGLWQEDRGRAWLGGALVGVACMMKMSPALFVAWWLLRGRWRAVGASVLAAVLLTLLSLPLVGPEQQLRFYTEILPGFGTGDYNGLRVPIGLFGNHSIPDLYHQLWPGEGGLSPTAYAASTATALALIAVVAALFARRPADLLARAGQISAVAVLMLLVPVYTYEHHLVWALPAVVALACACWKGRLSKAWLLLLVPAVVAWGFELATLKGWARALRDDGPLVAWLLREAKWGALVALLIASLALGRSRRAGL